LINLLESKGVIKKSELLDEIKRLRDKKKGMNRLAEKYIQNWQEHAKHSENYERKAR
jgi:hypothetical protein